MLRTLGLMTLTLSFATATMMVVERAEACSFAATVFDSTYPGWGATGVPTNVVPFAGGSSVDPSLLLLRPEGGEAVEIEIRAVEDYGWDLVPSAELLPNQRYELLAGDGNAISFETGAGPAEVRTREEALDVPRPEIVAVSASVGTCGTLGALCVAGEPSSGESLEIRTQDGAFSSIDGVRFSQAYSQPLAEGECLVVRARDVRGDRSPPVTLCDIEQRSSADESLDCASALADEPEPSPEGEPMLPPEGESPLPGPSMPPVGASGAAAESVDDMDTVALVPVNGAKAGCTIGPRASLPSGSLASTGLAFFALLALLGSARRRR